MPPEFVGQVDPFVPGYPYSIAVNGTISKIGDVVELTTDSVGHMFGYYATYNGFFAEPSGEEAYVFTLPYDPAVSYAVRADNSVAWVPSTQSLNSSDPQEGPYPACFLAGMLIMTPEGEVPVEELNVGDIVCTRLKEAIVPRQITWIGSNEMRAAHGNNDRYPVRIRANAFASDVPHSDLLLTSEHCIFVDDALIPVRMLVNDASIIVDRSINSFTYFHIELETHAILFSNGLETESYLDTGNRCNFSNPSAHGATVALVVDSSHCRWVLDAAAPLVVEQGLVEPVWHRLAERAEILGFRKPGILADLTDQPDLRLMLEDGRAVSACWHRDQHYMFQVPRGARPVRLLSRTGVPAEVIAPFVDDRRTLGVAVEKLVIQSGIGETIIYAAAMNLAGWHAAEGAIRWTDGNAALDLMREETDTFLSVHIAATGLYRVGVPGAGNMASAQSG